MTFQWCTPVKEMLCKRDSYGQQHGNRLRICNASPNTDLNPAGLEDYWQSMGCKPREKLAALKWTDVKATQHLGPAEKVCHPSINQPINIYGMPTRKKCDAGSWHISCSWAGYYGGLLNVCYFCLLVVRVIVATVATIIILLGPSLYFSDCKRGGNYIPFPNSSTVFQIHPWSTDATCDYQMVRSRINILSLLKKEETNKIKLSAGQGILIHISSKSCPAHVWSLPSEKSLAVNSHWLSILHVVVYMFSWYSLHSSHPLLYFPWRWGDRDGEREISWAATALEFWPASVARGFGWSCGSSSKPIADQHLSALHGHFDAETILSKSPSLQSKDRVLGFMPMPRRQRVSEW